ncbi:MAG TPA: type VII secretion protein EssB [Rummeliibacillus sp.]|nr:type VII secretion protein EssB [Rummeliibacillus sp.]
MENKLKLGEMELSLKSEEKQLILTLPLAETSIQSEQELHLLNQDTSNFLHFDVKVAGENIEFEYTLEGFQSFENIKKLERVDQLRLLHNIGRFSKLLNGRTTIILNPNNLVYDLNLMPFMIYRGIKNILPPLNNSIDEFLKAYKCIAIATFSSEFQFEDLMKGALTRATSTSYEKAVQQTETIEALQALLFEYYEKEKKKTLKQFQKVSKNKFKGFKIATLSLSIVSIILLSLVLYAFSSKIPTEELYNEANASFINENYVDVKEQLKDQKLEQLPKSIKKMYAISSVKTSGLTEEQKTNSINSIATISDDRLLSYWINIARNNFSESLKLAHSLDVNDLTKYSLILYQNQLKKNTTMDQEKKDGKLKEIESELKEIQDKEEESKMEAQSETQKAMEEKQKQEQIAEQQKLENQKKQKEAKKIEEKKNKE